MTPAMTSPTAAAARRGRRLERRTLTGERRRYGTNGGHQRVADGTANSPTTKATADDQRTATATSERADEDGDDLATTTATFPSDGDGWNDGGARLERRRRRQS
ncbi:calcineurin B-like protein [Oryza sativa Japonica Group]|uniref:Calcineurin B-like protein n=1 Tax=Oryza sativa subsp. japonica TaxID=39947 RepID=Q5SMR7_ORYSJ|nr:calcineurin B-like protein [Oryza sativa Japonica Group]BAD72486.1 calcineurin B-like protein [Oryza sativa Japonica Group]BAD72487.1 calcineurin B-like protein [Oryza sativa Japonica Group]